MEFACAAAMAGREVTVISSHIHPLKGFDPEAVAVLEAALPTLGAHGVEVDCGVRASRLEAVAGGIAVFTDEDERPVVADLVVNATGRVASVEGLGLDAAGVEASPKGVVVDRHLRAPGNPHVWAGGDVADNGRPSLIPTAVKDARVLTRNLEAAAEGGAGASLGSIDETPPATVAFTIPTIASVGLTEDAAKALHGDDLHVSCKALHTRKFYRQLGVEHAYFKLIFDGDRRLIGAHLVGPESEEVINLFAVAINEGCRESQLCDAVLTYPTVSAALQTAFRKIASNK